MERTTRWQADPFDGTRSIEVAHGGGRYRIDDAAAVAELRGALRVTAVENDIGIGSYPPTWLTFRKGDDSTLAAGLERPTMLSVLNGLVWIDGSFLPALQRHVSRLAGGSVDLLTRRWATEPVDDPQPAGESKPAPRTADPAAEQRERERRRREWFDTVAVVCRDLQGFIDSDVLNVDVVCRLRDEQVRVLLTSDQCMPILYSLRVEEVEALPASPEWWREELARLDERGAGGLRLTPGLGFSLHTTFEDARRCLIPYYGRLSFKASPVAAIRRAVAFGRGSKGSIRLLPE